jgi:hypothetical protein
MENSNMQHIVMALAAILIGAAFIAALPSPASAGARDHFKARQAERKQACCRKKAQRVIELKGKRTKYGVERKPKRVAKKAQRVFEAHDHGPVQAELDHHAVHEIAEAKLDSPDTANALVALAMRYDGKNPTGWSHNWCAHYLDMVLQEAGYPSGGNLARGYASYGKPTPARVGAIAVMPNHVGVVAFVGDDYVLLVSGNHAGNSGHRTVGLGRYAMSRITTFRMPLTREVIMADEPKLAAVKVG